MKVLNFRIAEYRYGVRGGSFLCGRGDPLVRPAGTLCGGKKASKQSVALARAGATVLHAGAVSGGTAALRSTFSPRAVPIPVSSVSSMRPAGTRSSRWTEGGRTCILLYGGANLQITGVCRNQVLAACDRGDVLLLQGNEINLLPLYRGKRLRAGMEIALNPSPHQRSAREAAAGKRSGISF